MNCPNCGNSIPDGSGFCTYCGKSLNQPPPQSQYAPPQSAYAPPQNPYAPPQSPYAPPQRQYAPPAYRDETVTMGEWFGFFVLLCIPICQIIMLFIWAFNPKIKRSKANLAKLYLLLIAIAAGISLIIGLIMVAVTGSFFGWY